MEYITQTNSENLSDYREPDKSGGEDIKKMYEQIEKGLAEIAKSDNGAVTPETAIKSEGDSVETEVII